MARPRSKVNVVCQSESCYYFLKEEGKDIIKRGINRAGNRQYYCFHCLTYFVETKGTPMYNRKISERKVKSICKELVNKKSIRSAAKDTKVNKNTVLNLLNDLANHALKLTNFLVHDLGLSTYEVDELFTFIKKSKRNLSPQMLKSLNKAKQSLQHA
jgi:transposase-like protein